MKWFLQLVDGKFFLFIFFIVFPITFIWSNKIIIFFSFLLVLVLANYNDPATEAQIGLKNSAYLYDRNSVLLLNDLWSVICYLSETALEH